MLKNTIKEEAALKTQIQVSLFFYSPNIVHNIDTQIFTIISAILQDQITLEQLILTFGIRIGDNIANAV